MDPINKNIIKAAQEEVLSEIIAFVVVYIGSFVGALYLIKWILF